MSEHDEEFLARAQSRVGALLCSKYRVERVLGIGGMATVYAGTHRNGRAVAIKMLHSELSMRKDIRTRFLREGQAANAVKHPGAVAVIDDDVAEDGAAFLVMERLEGITLERVWEDAGQRLPERVVLAAGRELCSILGAAHRAGIIHRDIKPENLFLTDDGTLKVLDFGLAQLRDAARPKETHTGMVFGTPAFMPPEQASGQISQIDARTDIWAVGATMFTLLSGKMVHEGETAQHFVMLAATEPARSLRTVLPAAAPDLVDLVDRALSRDKRRRWPSADAMHEAIRATSRSLLNDPDVPIPQPRELKRSRSREPEIGVLRVAGGSDEPTRVKPIAKAADQAPDATQTIEQIATPSDEPATAPMTRQDVASAHRPNSERSATPGDSSAPPTQPKPRMPIAHAASATPTPLIGEEDPTAEDLRPAAQVDRRTARDHAPRVDFAADHEADLVQQAQVIVLPYVDQARTTPRHANTVRRLPAMPRGAANNDARIGRMNLLFLRRREIAFVAAIAIAGIGFGAFVLVRGADRTPPPTMRLALPTDPIVTDTALAPPAVSATPMEDGSALPSTPPVADAPPAKKSLATARPPPPTKPKRSCSPPYDLEANGRKRWKMECL